MREKKHFEVCEVILPRTPSFSLTDVQVRAQYAAGSGGVAKEEERPELRMGGR